MRKLPNRKQGFSLVEIVLAIALFSIVVSSVAVFTSNSFRASQRAQQKITNNLLIQEVYNSLKSTKHNTWSQIITNTDAGPKHLAFANNQYTIQNGPQVVNGTTLSFTISSVQRDSNGIIVPSGGTNDVHSRKINFTASWVDPFGSAHNTTSSYYVNDWNTNSWSQTSQSDWQNGVFADTVITNNSGGEVALSPDYYANSNWCNPSLTLTQYDMPGNSVSKAISATPGNAYLGAGPNTGNIAFINAVLNSNDPPGISTVATFIGEKTNDVFGEPDYAYVTTDNNSREVRIIDLRTQPYTEIGYFNSTNSTANGIAIFVSGNRGYVTTDNQLRVFDLTSKVGSRPQLGSRTLSGNGSDLWVIGDYAYVSIAGAARELEIVNVSNPASMSITGWADVNGQAATVIYVQPDGNRTFLGTNADSGLRELFVINTTSKTGSRANIGTYETNGMSIKGMSLVGNRLVLGGTGGQEYQVVDVENIANPVKCGNLEVNSGINGLAAVLDASNNAYSYIITNDSSSELKVIKGGKENVPLSELGGSAYREFGTFVSPVFDTGSTTTQYYVVSWKQQLPAGTQLQLKVRTGPTSNLTSIGYVGPDGTGATYFTDPNGTLMPSVLNNKRYIQFIAYLQSPPDLSQTPVLEDITFNYGN
jgi:prepilin-type N-terminal cleavage/methylation domain-containing protein